MRVPLIGGTSRQEVLTPGDQALEFPANTPVRVEASVQGGGRCGHKYVGFCIVIPVTSSFS